MNPIINMMGIFDGLDQISLDNIDLSEPLAPQNRLSNSKGNVPTLPGLKLNRNTLDRNSLNRYSLKSVQLMPFNNEEELEQPQWKSRQHGNPSFKIRNRLPPSSVEPAKNVFIYQDKLKNEKKELRNEKNQLKNDVRNEKNELRNENKFESEKIGKAFKIRSRSKVALCQKVTPKNYLLWAKMKNGVTPSIAEMVESDLQMLKMVPDMQIFAMKLRRQEQFRKQKAMENWESFNYVNAHPL